MSSTPNRRSSDSDSDSDSESGSDSDSDSDRDSDSDSDSDWESGQCGRCMCVQQRWDVQQASRRERT